MSREMAILKNYFVPNTIVEAYFGFLSFSVSLSMIAGDTKRVALCVVEKEVLEEKKGVKMPERIAEVFDTVQDAVSSSLSMSILFPQAVARMRVRVRENFWAIENLIHTAELTKKEPYKFMSELMDLAAQETPEIKAVFDELRAEALKDQENQMKNN